jgi:hypothetical protein
MQTGIIDAKYNTQKIKLYVSASLFLFISVTERDKYIKINHLSLISDFEKYKPFFNYLHKY